jgi:multidrug efflux system outer membrane protein
VNGSSACLVVVLAGALSGCALLGESEARRRHHDLVEEPQPADPAPRPAGPAAPGEEELAIQRKPALGLLDCQRLAVLRSERLRAEAERVHQSDLGVISAASALSPQATYNLAYFKQEEKVKAHNSAPNQTQTHWVELHQPVFRGFSDWFAISAANDQVHASESELRAVKLDVALSCGRAFYAAVSLEKTVETLVHSLKLEDDRLKEVKAREDSGLARKTERLFIETDRARTEADLARARHDLIAAREALAYFTGVADAPLEAAGTTPPRPLPLEHYLDGAKDRPDIALLAHQVEHERHEVWAARGAFLPTMDATSNLWLQRDGTFRDVSWDVTLGLSWNFFDGGKELAALRIAESHTREAERTYADACRHAASEIATDYQALLGSLDQIPTLETRVRAAEENVRLLDVDYRAGIATNLEAVEAENTRRQANLDLERERYNARALELQLRAASGDETLTPGAYPPSLGDEPGKK